MNQQVAAPDTTDQTKTAKTLQQFLSSVQSTVRRAHSTAEIVETDLVNYRPSTGENSPHAFELVQKQGDKTVASLHAIMWPNDFNKVAAKFKAAGETLDVKPGEYMLTLRVELSDKIGYRFQGVITDIDLNFALGQHEVQRRKIREFLKKEGEIDLNRSLPKPRVLRRIAVLTPSNSAAEGDFKNDGAERLSNAGACEFVYRKCTFSGPNAADRFVGQLGNLVNKDHAHNPFDLIVIIRGGGEKGDLMDLNQLRICRTVCRTPIPILAGIGHHRDKGDVLLNELVSVAVDTPSKAMQWIQGVLEAEGNELAKHLAQIPQVISERVRTEQAEVERLAFKFSLGLNKLVSAEEKAVRDIAGDINRAINAKLAKERLDLDKSIPFVVRQIGTRLAKERQWLNEHPATLLSAQMTSIVKAERQWLTDQIKQFEYIARDHLKAERADVQHCVEGVIRELADIIKSNRRDLVENHSHFVKDLQHRLKSERSDLNQFELGFNAGNPLELLKKGFALTKDAQGNVITSAEQARAAKRLDLTFADDHVSATVDPK